MRGAMLITGAGGLTAALVAVVLGVPCREALGCSARRAVYRTDAGTLAGTPSAQAPAALRPGADEAFHRSLWAMPYLGEGTDSARAGALAPTRCRVARRRDGVVELIGPGRDGALTCQVTLAWRTQAAAQAYALRVAVQRPCRRARGSTLGPAREVLAVVTSPFYRCDITVRVLALAPVGAEGALATVDSTDPLRLVAVGRRP